MRTLVIIVLAFAAVGLVGCGATPAGSGQPAATAAPTLPPAGSECAAAPTFDLSGSGATFSLPRDEAIEAKFPAQIDGQPVTEIESGRLIDTLCMFGGQAGIDRLRSQSPSTLDMLSLVVGSAKATVEDEEVQITAFRMPGRDGSQLLQNIVELAKSVSGGESRFTGDLTPVTVGGKNAYSWTDEDGNTSYIYVSGDALIVVDGITQSQADRIFSAFS